MSVRQVLELYLNGQKVDLNDNGGIFLNYQQKEYRNPTIVKNSFSKTLTIPGTDINNQIFNNIWHLTRVQTTALVPYFNQSKRCDFDLFMNGELIEQGYCKLDNIQRNGAEIAYQLTLYGGLGDFFYSLSYDTTNGIKKTLASLDYGQDLTFTINKETVKQSWDDLQDGLLPPITFAPCYNGFPDIIDAEKVLVNTNGFNGTIRVNDGNAWTEQSGFPTSSDGYSTVNGYALAEGKRNLTEWQTRDLRSYLQRPVIHIPFLFDAICDPNNNGGYEVELDPDFFNTGNSYYQDAYLTLPLISELNNNKVETTETIEGSIDGSVGDSTGETNIMVSLDGKWDKYFLTIDLIAASNETAADELYTSLRVAGQGVGYIWGGFGMQLIGLDANRNQVAGSNIWWISSEVDGMRRSLSDMTNGISMDSFKYSTEVNNSYGYFEKRGQFYFWSETGLTFTMESNVKIDSYRIKILPGNRFGNSTGVRNNYLGKVWSANTATQLTAGYTLGFNALLDSAQGGTSSDVISITDTEVTQDTLLSTNYTPADYLISYCKLFNLYFDKDVFRKKIRIYAQKNFYNGSIDLSDDIDNKLDIKPLSFDHKWYSFKYQNAGGKLATDYKAKYGTEYGQQRVNTGYEFDSETEELLNNNAYVNAVECLEANKYYVQANLNGVELPPFMTENATYKLFNASMDAKEMEIGINRNADMDPLNPKSVPGIFYDSFSKVQFHNEGKPIDGANVLLFFNGMQPTIPTYWLSDDVGYMFQVNDKATWLYTSSEYDAGGNHIALGLDAIPHFSRYISDSSYIYASWDFGRVKELYIPEISYLDGETTIYERYWQLYIGDLYDVDTRIVTAYIKFDEKPTKESLKHFYFFENSYWVIQDIIDYNPTSYDLTKVIFVKVNDTANYLNTRIIPPEPPVPADTISITAVTPIAATSTTLGYTVTAGDYCKVQILGQTRINGHGPGTNSDTLPIPENLSRNPKYYTVNAWLTMNPNISASTVVKQNASEAPINLSITAPSQIDATATSITYTVTADYAGTVKIDGGSLPAPIYNIFPAGSSTYTVTIPANTHSYVEYYGLEAKLNDYPSVTAYTSVEQMGTQTPIYTNIPLTFEVSTAGTINWKHNRTLTGDIGNLTIQYRINGGTWTNLTSSTAGTTFSVAAGDIVEFRGDNIRYSSLPLSYTTFSGSTAGFEAYGNIMSLISSTDYETATTLSEQYCFNRLFAGTKITNAENLVLPATTLPMHVYTSMFQNCTLMTKAPSLPAPTLTNSCYNEMFNGCSSLSYIRCLATDISAYNCTYNWVANVANTGTFVKAPTMTAWTLNSDNGVPVNWTLIDDLGTLTGITLDNVTWVTDVPYTGGLATYQNCSYTVTGHYDNGATSNLTSQAIFTASTTLNVPATTSTTRENVGVINVIAEYYDGPNPFSSTVVVPVYQAAAQSQERYVTLHLVYTGNTSTSFPVIAAVVANVAPQTWTPTYVGETYDMVFSAGQVTDSTIMVTAVDQVPPYLDTITGLLQGGSLSDTDTGTGQAGITMQINFSFGQSTIVQFYCDITGYDNN